MLGATSAIRLVNACLGVVNAALLARVLGITEFGSYAFVYAVILIASIPARMGLPQLVVRETAYALSDQAPNRIVGIWRWAFRAVILVSALVTLLFVGVSWIIPSSDTTTTLLAAALMVPLISMGNLRGGALRGLGKVVQGQLPELILRPAFFAGILLWVLVLPPAAPMTAAIALLWHTAAAGLAFLIGTLMLRRQARRLGPATPEPFGSRAMLLSAMALGTTAGLSVLNNNIDLIMIRVFMTDAEVGLYKAAATMGSLVIFGLQVVTTLITPRIATLFRQKETARLERLLSRAAQFSFATSFLVLIVFVLFGQPLLLLLFGPDFPPAYYALVILSVGFTLKASFGTVANLLAMSGHERDALRAVIVATLSNIFGNAVLVYLMGIEGAAIGTLLSLLIYRAMLQRTVRTKLGLRVSIF